MSRLTSKWRLQGFLAFAVLVARTAFAGPALDEAQAKRSKAFNDFYTGYMNSPHQPSDAQAISATTIAPASDATVRALLQERASALKQAGVQVMTQEQADAAHAKAQAKLEAEGDDGEGDGDRLAAEGKEKPPEAGLKEGARGTGKDGPAGIARKPAAPEAVLDGSKIPAQIIFGGATGKAAKATGGLPGDKK